MTASTRETAGSVRSAHVAYFMPPDWTRIAHHAVPALERAAGETSGETSAVRLLILVPDAGAAVAMSRAISALPAAKGLRVVAATSPARLQRLLGAGPADCVVGSPEAIAAALTASALKLSDVKTVFFAAADEMDAESDALASVMQEVPKEATRVLTALAVVEGVEEIITRYLARARRVQEDVVPADGTPSASLVRYLTVVGRALDALPMLLDELDAPSAAVLVGDEDVAKRARKMLASVGYIDGGLATVTTGEIRPNTSLIVSVGVPTATAWTAAVTAAPAQIVVLCAPRDLESLRLLAGDATPRPLADRGTISKARAVESRRRAELRAELAVGIPSREVLALEPLLLENDGLEIAAAALRLLERTRSEQSELVLAAEQRVRSAMREAQKEKEAAEKAERGGSDRGDRGDRGGDRPRPSFGGAPRSFGGPPRATDRPPRERDDRPRDRDEKPRVTSFSKDRDKPRSSSFSRDDKPRTGGFKRDDKPRTGGFKRDDRPRDDRPRTGGFKRDDKPRSGGGRPPRGDR